MLKLSDFGRITNVRMLKLSFSKSKWSEYVSVDDLSVGGAVPFGSGDASHFVR